MTRARRKVVRHYLTATVIGLAAAWSYTYLRTGRFWDYFAATLVTVLIVLGVCVVEKALSPRLRRMSFPVNLAGHFAGYIVAILASFYSGVAVSRLLERRTHPFDFKLHSDTWASLGEPELTQAYFWAFLVLAALVAHRELSRKLGPGVLRNWLLGRYHRPRQEERVFMFLDLKGSTALAESLGDLRFSEMVREFFADITPAIVETEAEVSHFIGDSVLVTWRLKSGLRESNCVRCFFLAKAELERRREKYLAKFGAAPQFKAGLHAGSVVTTDVGVEKSEIVFHGDVVNTAARIESVCNEVGADLLVSEGLLQLLGSLDGLTVRPAGEFQLRGKREAIRLFSLAEGVQEAQAIETAPIPAGAATA